MNGIDASWMEFDLDKNAIRRIECGKRFVTDIELSLISKAIVDDSENSPLFEHPASCAI